MLTTFPLHIALHVPSCVKILDIHIHGDLSLCLCACMAPDVCILCTLRIYSYGT